MKRSGSMKKYLGVLVAVFCLVAVSMFFATTTVTSVCAADETEITGAMNVTGQLVTEDGSSYFIAQDEIGKKLAALVGKKVNVKGVVKSEGDAKTLTVSSFEEI